MRYNEKELKEMKKRIELRMSEEVKKKGEDSKMYFYLDGQRDLILMMLGEEVEF